MEPSSTQIRSPFKKPWYVRVLFDFTAQTDSEISVVDGDIIEVIREEDDGWSLVRYNNSEGYIPTSYYDPTRIIIPRKFTREEAATFIQRAYRLRKNRSKLAKLNIKRQQVIEEIIKTEETYVESLEVIRYIYEKVKQKNLLTPKQLSAVFSNSDILLNLNKTLLNNLKKSQKRIFYQQNSTTDNTPDKKRKMGLFRSSKRPKSRERNEKEKRFSLALFSRTKLLGKEEGEEEEEDKSSTMTFGAAFKKITPFLKVYTVYINNYSQASDTLRECSQTNTNFDKYLIQCKSKPKCKGYHLSSYLIQPIQRIPRYRLLLQELIKYTPKEHYDLKELESTLELIKGVANHLNENRKRWDAHKVFAKIQQQFSHLNYSTQQQQELDNHQSMLVIKHQSFIQPYRHFVREGDLKLNLPLNGQERFVKCDLYLFSDVLLIASNDPQHKIDIRRVLHLCFLSGVEPDETSKQRFKIKFIVGDEVLLFEAYSEEVAMDWMNDINNNAKGEILKLEEDAPTKSLADAIKLRQKYKQDYKDTIDECWNMLLYCAQKLKTIDSKIKKQDNTILHFLRNDTRSLQEYFGGYPKIDTLTLEHAMKSDQTTNWRPTTQEIPSTPRELATPREFTTTKSKIPPKLPPRRRTIKKPLPQLPPRLNGTTTTSG